MLEVAEFISAHGSEGVLIILFVFFMRGDILTKSAVENIVKLTVTEISRVLEDAVRDGIREAMFPLSKDKE